MAGIVDYASLKTELANFTHRSDQSSELDTLIQFAEAEFNRKLRFRQMLTTIQPVNSGNVIALPSDFLELRNVELQGDPLVTLKFVTTEQKDFYDSGVTTGQPRLYSIVGSNIYLYPTPDQVYTANLQYFQTLPTLVGGVNTTNWLLGLYPDLYLFGALVRAGLYIGLDPRLPEWSGFYTAALADAMQAAADSMYSGDTITMQPDVSVW